MPVLADDPADRYIPNTMSMQVLESSPKELLQASLEKLVTEMPPRAKLGEADLWGFTGGYIGIPLLLLHVSVLHPYVQVKGHSLREWAQRYLEREPGPAQQLPLPMCGLVNEPMSYNALRAGMSGAEQDVDRFLADFAAVGERVPEGEEDEYDTEIMQGRAGALYFLRLVRHWVPDCTEKINAHIDRVAERLMEANNHGEKSWLWQGKAYVGAVHGDIGNITQLVLSKPSLAGNLEPLLKKLLALQFDDGGWPMFSNRDETETKTVQFCHGAPGFIRSLWSLRPHFPGLSEEIDKAIEKAQSCVWEKGLLKKEPSLCHGILGNGL